MTGPPAYPDGGVDGPAGLAALVAGGAEEADRDEVRTLLADGILPPLLIDLPDHPDPDALLREAYDEIADGLADLDPNEWLPHLRLEARAGELHQLVSSARELAMIRYAIDHPDAVELARTWLSQDGRGFLETADVDAVTAGADELLERLATWCEDAAQAAPEVATESGQEVMMAKTALASARSGNFATAVGPLADFLRDAGAEVDVLDIH